MKARTAALAALSLSVVLAAAAAPAAPDPLRASQLVGKEARDAAGARLGRIEDLLLDPAAGDLEYVIVSKDGAPSTRVAERLALDAGAVAVLGEGAGSLAGEPLRPGLVRGSELLGADVRHAASGDVGDVEDLMIGADGRVTHVVVAFDPRWYEAQGWVAVPWRSFRRDGGDLVAAFEPDDLRPEAARAREEAARAAAAAQAARTAASERMKDRDVRLGKLVKAPVKDRTGRPVAVVADLVLDLHERRIAFALVSPVPGTPPLACRIARGGLAIVEDGLALPDDAAALAGVPSCTSAGWPRDEGGETPRYVLASELLRASMHGPAGGEVGKLREVVVEADDGVLHYLVADFDATWLQDGKLATLALRPVRRTSGGLSMQAEVAELHRMPIIEEKRLADVWSPAFARAMDKYLAGR